GARVRRGLRLAPVGGASAVVAGAILGVVAGAAGFAFASIFALGRGCGCGCAGWVVAPARGAGGGFFSARLRPCVEGGQGVGAVVRCAAGECCGDSWRRRARFCWRRVSGAPILARLATLFSLPMGPSTVPAVASWMRGDDSPCAVAERSA